MYDFTQYALIEIINNYCNKLREFNAWHNGMGGHFWNYTQTQIKDYIIKRNYLSSGYLIQLIV